MTSPQLSAADQWRAFFENWPAQIPRRGIVTNSLNEAMPFKGYMAKDDLVLLERTNPDAMGGRFILLNYNAINSVKLIDPLKEADAQAAGFAGKFTKM